MKKYKFRLMSGTHKEDGKIYSAHDGKRAIVASDMELDKKFRNKFTRLGTPKRVEIEEVEEEEEVVLDLQDEDEKTALDLDLEGVEDDEDEDEDEEPSVEEILPPKPKKKKSTAKKSTAKKSKRTKTGKKTG